MHTKRHVIEQVLRLSQRTIFELLYLRVVLDVADDYQSLEQDIEDLLGFPERIEGSYRDEWLAFIKRQLYRRAFKVKGVAARENLQQFLITLINEDKARIKATYTRHREALERAIACEKNDTIVVFPSPVHQWLATAIK